MLSLLLPGILLSVALPGQNAVPIGQWRSHLPYRVGQWVTQSDDKVFYSADWSVVEVDKADDAVSFLSTVNGLSNAGIERLRYNSFSDVLIIIYRNSVIDLVKPGGIVTLNQIRNFRNFPGDKFIRDIFVENDSIVYLAANYGLSKLNIAADEFVFSTFTGIEIDQVVLYEGLIYAATAEGIYTIRADAPNPEDFSAWRLLGPGEGFPGDYSTHALALFNGGLYADVNDTIVRVEAGGLQRLHHEPGFRVEYLSAEGSHLLAGLRCVTGCAASKLRAFAADGGSREAPFGCIGDPKYAIEDQSGRIWFADGFREFRRLGSLDAANCEFRTYNSPFSESSREMTFHNDTLWLAAGAVDQRFNNRFLAHGFASFAGGQWTIYNRVTLDAMRGENPNDPNDDLLDIISIAVNPTNGKVYAASYFEGLLELDGGKAVFFNEKNSSLGNAVGDPTRTRASGLAFDEDDNLWVSNFLAERPLSVLRPDGAWQSFNLSCGQTQLHQIDIDPNGYKWIVVAGGQAGVVLFDAGDLDNPTDDRCRVFSTSNSNLPTNQTNCLAVDLLGDVWVGTAAGVLIFECGGNAFDANCQGTRRVVQGPDGVNAFLLSSEDVQTIAVDGANRKWIGTRNGVFVLSPGGDEEIARFTVDNSPLFDNNIIDIAVNPRSGEVFIGTNRGVISYQSDAVAGERVNLADITVFPNPVRPEYDGPIAIRGLARDANVKITDVNGQLVYETTALGGQAIWDGRDYTGRRANSGVYLVFATSNPRDVGFTAKPSAAVARIVLLN